MTNLQATLAILVRNLRIAIRRPDLLLQAMAVPVVVLGLASVIFGAGDAWPVAVIDQSRTPQSRAVVRALEQTRGATGPYFRIVTDDPGVAHRLVEEGRLHVVVTIPTDFPASSELHTRTYNINTDAMKNVRLRLVTSANIHDRLAGLRAVTARFDKARPTDVTRPAFMAGSAVILALLLGGALIAANLYALDSEHRTRKEIALTPLGTHHAAVGSALAGWLLPFIASLPTVALALAFGTTSTLPGLAQASLIVLPAGLAAAGLGVLAAIGLKTHRLIQPAIILLGLGSYFASGGFIPVAALPPLARGLASWWPPSYVFEWANPLLHGFVSSAGCAPLGAVATAALATVALAGRGAVRDHRSASGQGQ